MLRAGANETLTYNFVQGNLIENIGQNQKLAYKLSNALSPDIQYYRLSLTPSLLEKIHPNIKTGYSRFVLYEMSRITEKSFKDHKEADLPEEQNRLAIVLTDDSKISSAAYYQARIYLDYLMTELGIKPKILPFVDQHLDPKFAQAAKLFEPTRSGYIYAGDVFLGIIGEPKQSIKKILKLPNYTSMMELDLTKLSETASQRIYVQLSHYPKIEQDVCFRIPSDVKYAELYNMAKKIISKSLKDTNTSLEPIDIFQGESPDYKQITLRLSLNSYTKTLKKSDLVDLTHDLEVMVKTDFAGKII